MKEYRLELAARYLRRQFEKAVGRSIAKIIAELVTNSDDSYKRILRQAEGKPQYLSIASQALPIVVFYDRRKRQFQVIDNAEGLSDEEMKERFVTYGKESADRSMGMRTRSLFGKGLRDVLFTQRYGQVKSIKNGKLYTCRFRWKKEGGSEFPIVEIRPPARVTKELREALGVPGNGTVVEFALADQVRAPQHETLAEKLANFYLLRMINSSPHREVVLRTLNASGKELSAQLTFEPLPGELAAEVNGSVRTEDDSEIPVEGEIRLSLEPLSQGELGYEDRRGGLLVVDEDDTVLDLTLFGFDEDPDARRIFGLLRLQGASDYIRRKLNQEAPEEILTETRDGFDKKHAFYKSLRDFTLPFLRPIVDREAKEKSTGKGALSNQTLSRHRQAFDILNKLYRDMLGKMGRVPSIPGRQQVPPPDGIAFLTSAIAVQRGVETPLPLLVNTVMVGPDEQIYISSDAEEVQVKPASLSHGTREPVQVVVKMLHVLSRNAGITATVKARWGQTEKQIRVESTEREISMPVDGLEFDRPEYAIRFGASRTLKLFVDTSKVPLGSTIRIEAEGTNVNIGTRSAILSSNSLLTSTVGEMRVEVSGVSLGEANVTASTGSYVAGTIAVVVRRDNKPEGQEGIFRDYEFRALDRKVQTLFDPRGVILINTNDPVNAKYFGSDPEAAIEKETYCQLRLADLILSECLQYMVTQGLEHGRLDRQFPDNPEIDVWNYVNAKKFEIGPVIHGLFVRGFA